MNRPAPFYIVEPYVDGPNRFRHATVLSEHATAEAAFVELECLTERLRGFSIPTDQFQWSWSTAGAGRIADIERG
jgi:hypothetical protein